MTKKEFAQRVAIALAGNPRFTSSDNFSVYDITRSAERLADYFEEHSDYGEFDGISREVYMTGFWRALERQFDIKKQYRTVNRKRYNQRKV